MSLSLTMRKIFSRLGIQNEEIANLYNIPILQKDDLADYSNALEDIYNRKIDGLIIKNALDSITINKLLNYVQSKERNLDEKYLIGDDKGFTYPITFPKVASLTDDKKEKYFLDNIQDRKMLTDEIGFDIENTISETFLRLSGNRLTEIPCGFNGEGSYLGYTFRSLVPQKGDIPIHCGNFFHDLFGHFYEHLSSICTVENQLSYFYPIAPSDGGELVLYDLEWRNGQKKVNDTTVEDIDRSVLNFAKGTGLKRMTLDLKKGDLLIFAGGQIWHSVNMVLGSTNRVTLGGFIGFSNDFEKVYFWS